MPYSETARQTSYVVEESSFGVIPAFGNSNAFRFISHEANPNYADIERQDKTGSYSQTVPIPDNKSAGGTMSCSLVGSGAAGTPSDIAPWWKATLGKQTINAGTSVVFEPDDVNPSLAIMLCDKPTSVDQLILFGSLISQARIQLGAAIPIVEFTYTSRWGLNKDLFADTDTAGRGGLTSFPAEPGAPVTSGVPPRGRTGTITLDGNAYTIFEDATITIATGKSHSNPEWGSVYPGSPQSTRRTITIDLNMYDDDSVNLKALKAKALAKTPVDFTLQIGATAGNIHTFLLKNLILPMPQYGWSGIRRTVRFPAIRCAATSATSKDEFRYTAT